jgi:hypothetical protein
MRYSNADLGLGEQQRSVEKASSAMNRPTVNPIPRVAPRPTSARVPTSAGASPTPVRLARRLAADHPDRLA